MSIGIKRENDVEMETSSTASDSGAGDLLYKKLEEFQLALELDDETVRNTWESYMEISRNITLEGNEVYWLACCLFVTCRMVTADNNSSSLKPISMTSLLRLSELSLNQFYENVKKWISMAKIPNQFLEEVETSERNFIVCQNVYKYYFANFKRLFKMPDNEAIRNRKQMTQCSSLHVFEFTWLLFILLKGKYMKCANDLVECLKIILACFNLSFRNVFRLNQREILNPEFEGLPTEWHQSTNQAPSQTPCALDKLLDAQEWLKIADVKYMQDYKVQPYLVQLIQAEQLRGNEEDLTDLFSPANFQANYASLNEIYEQFILDECCYDEKIFLADAYRQTVLQSMCSNGEGDMITDTPINDRRRAIPETPLTGRQYLGPRDDQSGVNTRKALLTLLNNRPSGISVKITGMFAENANANLTENITATGTELATKLAEGLTSNGVEDAKEKEEVASKLFYYILEVILAFEKNMNKDIAVLVERAGFLESIFVCGTEILIFAFTLPKVVHFPWVLKWFNMPASHFVRIIEPVVRCRPDFSRDTIKHLSYVEESILDSLMWCADSILWKELTLSDYEIPKFEEIAIQATMNSLPASENMPSTRRSLFGAGQASTSTSESFQSPRYSNIRPGQSLLNSNRNQLAVQNAAAGGNNTNGTATTPKRNLRYSIIMRKFYVLAYVRMDDLCRRLNLNDPNSRMKIWTVFEHSIRKTDLIKNRHLDQLIMCAVYVICKLDPKSMKFTEIMDCYRSQPQWNRDIYRNVYIDDKKYDNLIAFYNTIYITKLKRFVLQFTRSSDSSNLALSPLPATTPLVSPRSQITRNVFVNSLESPTSMPAEFTQSRSYYFNRSDSRDLRNINKVVSRKRLLADSEMRGDCKHVKQRKLLAVIEDRNEVQNKTT